MNQYRHTESFKSELAKEAPLISVIMPVFNKALFVAEAVESLVAQNHSNLEILLRDDGSTDASLSVLETFPQKYPNVRFQIFTDSNKGASYSRNFLIERATSPLLILMDADDIMLPRFIAEALLAMRTTDARVIYSDVALNGAKDSEWCPPPFDPFTIRYGNCLTSLVMIDKALHVEAGRYDTGLPFNEDWSFFIRAAQKSRQFHRLPGKYFIYRQTPSGLYQSYILDNWSLNQSLVMAANTDLYPIHEVLNAVEVLRTIPEPWVTRFATHAERFPERYLPFLILSLQAQRAGNHEQALLLMQRAVESSQGQEWLTLYLFGSMLEASNPKMALIYFHLARTCRPDLCPLLNERIQRLSERA